MLKKTKNQPVQVLINFDNTNLIPDLTRELYLQKFQPGKFGTYKFVTHLLRIYDLMKETYVRCKLIKTSKSVSRNEQNIRMIEDKSFRKSAEPRFQTKLSEVET